MKIDIPINKDNNFSAKLFNLLSKNFIELKNETGKWPECLILSGSLGKEIHSFFIEKAWELSQFNPQCLGLPNKIIIKYSKPINQIKDVGKTIFDDKMGDRTISGIPSSDTMKSLFSTYSNLSYTLEKTIRPFREIRLFRK
jgi:hypothetical protein